MKLPDLDRERCEKSRTLPEFLELYNADLPEGFPRATREALLEYRASHQESFKNSKTWTLDVHRKKIMDWLRVAAPTT
jgi:hypothetical protein